MFPPSSVPYPCTSSRATRIYRTTHRAKIYSEYVIIRTRYLRGSTGSKRNWGERRKSRNFLRSISLFTFVFVASRSSDTIFDPLSFARSPPDCFPRASECLSSFLPFDGAHRQRGSERAEGRGRQSFTRVRRGSIYRCTGGGMINGRVERCADNIMRRIVPGPTRTEPLALPRPSGPRKEISPGHGGKRVSTSIFRELRVFSNILSFVIFRNVTRLLPRNVESIFDLP